MKYKYLLLVVAGLLSFYSTPALSQIITTTNSNNSRTQSNTKAESVTVPGFYYQPTLELPPSLSEMEGTSESGLIQTNYLDPNQIYNPQRVWQKGATPDTLTKIGDLTTNPELAPFFNFKKLTFQRIVGTQNPASTPLKSIGIINSMTLGEFLEIFPELQNQAVIEVLILKESLNTKVKVDRLLTQAQQLLVENLAANPAFENVSLEAIATGDWEAAISQAEQELLQQIVTQYPELEPVPVNRLFPLVAGAIDGDWQSVLNQAQQIVAAQGEQISTSQLLSLVPQLQDIPLGALPIDDLVLGDIEGLEDTTLEEVPDLENRYLSQVGNLSQDATAYLSQYEPEIFTGDLFGKLDIAYAGETEYPITHILSGGTRNQIFKSEPCFEKSCKHFEITDIFNPLGLEGELSGKAWVQGTSQDVPGGKGFLIPVNGGVERTGVSVWSPDAHVKLSLENIDEGGNGIPASAQVWLNFQFCVYPPFLGEHCTPHFIPIPTPWKVQEGGLMLVFSRDKPSELIKNARNEEK